jgi:valyl-tRNA synthetase
MEVVRLVRQIRSESDIIPSMRIEVLLSTGHPRFEETVRSNEEWINSLTKTEKITMGKNLEKPEGSAASSLVLDWEDHRDESRVDLYIPISLYVDLDKERDRLTREIKKAETEMSKAGNKLNNQKFIGKAPADVVEKEKAKFEKFQAISEKLKANLATLEKK